MPFAGRSAGKIGSYSCHAGKGVDVGEKALKTHTLSERGILQKEAIEQCKALAEKRDFAYSQGMDGFTTCAVYGGPHDRGALATVAGANLYHGTCLYGDATQGASITETLNGMQRNLPVI